MPEEKKKKSSARSKKVTQKKSATKSTKALTKKTTRAKSTIKPKRKPAKRKSVVVSESAVAVPIIVDTQTVTVPTPNKLSLTRTGHHPWSLRHHGFGIFAVTFVATAAIFFITAFTDIALSNIVSYETSSPSLIVPAPSDSAVYVTPAGNMTITLPTTWTMIETTDRKITYAYAGHDDIRLSFEIQPQDTSSVLAWVQDHDQSYVNGEVIAPGLAVAKKAGIQVSGTNSEGSPVHTAYWEQAGSDANYIVITTLTTTTSVVGKLAQQDMERAINQIEFASGQN